MAPRKPWLTVPTNPIVPKAGNFGLVELRGSNGIQRRADLYPLLVDMAITITRGGEATLTLTLADPNHDLLTSGTLDAILDPTGSGRLARGDLRAAGVWWRVQAVKRQDATVTIECEDRAIAYLRQHDRPLAMSRRTVTRAQFIRRLIGEVRANGGIPYYIPELSIRQPVMPGERADTAAERAASAVSKKTAGSRGASGFGGKAGQVRIKGRAPNSQQLRCLDEALTEAQRLGASRRVLIATNMCLTQESMCGHERYIHRGDGPGPDSRGPYQQRAPWGPESVRKDNTLSTRMWLTGGRGGQSGWKQKHGSLRNASGNLNAMIVAVQVSVGGYAQWERESTRNVDLWLARNGGDSARSAAGESTTEPGAQTVDYQYRRGEVGGARENSWLCGQRLADEVNWSLFTVANTVWYGSDREFAAPRPVAELDRTDDAVVSIRWDQDARAAVDQAEVIVTWNDNPWQLTPGMPVALVGEGPADGRWLIDEARIGLLGHTSTLTLARPGARKREPAAEVKQREQSGGGSGSAASPASSTSSATGAQAVYDAAVAISAKRYPYAWGGGHPSAGSPSRGTNRSNGGQVVTGYDCSGAVGAALAAAGWGYRRGQPVPASGTMAASWGRAGRGKKVTVWANANHVFLEFHSMGRIRSLDTGPTRSIRALGGPHAYTTVASTAGFTPRHWPGN
ncbi:MAG: hypothetical protein M0P31_13710 [Solirubrobacteraceae bacterium]|nr:hypothetical protein [Solirubrobacteraceae bacterium]